MNICTAFSEDFHFSRTAKCTSKVYQQRTSLVETFQWRSMSYIVYTCKLIVLLIIHLLCNSDSSSNKHIDIEKKTQKDKIQEIFHYQLTTVISQCYNKTLVTLSKLKSSKTFRFHGL